MAAETNVAREDQTYLCGFYDVCIVGHYGWVLQGTVVLNHNDGPFNNPHLLLLKDRTTRRVGQGNQVNKERLIGIRNVKEF